jgi:cytidine deaminase
MIDRHCSFTFPYLMRLLARRARTQGDRMRCNCTAGKLTRRTGILRLALKLQARKKPEFLRRVYNGARFGGFSARILPAAPHLRYMAKKTVSAKMRKKLEQAAMRVMKNAHAPYSNFHVGAAILLTNGKMFSGCNVENASYGMTNCAERTAIFSAVAELGPKIEIQAVAVTNDHGVACSPCGACRQVIYEFGPDATIFFQGAAGPKQAHITELLPEGFRLQ